MKKKIKDPRGRKSLPDSEKKKVVSIMAILIKIEKEYSSK